MAAAAASQPASGLIAANHANLNLRARAAAGLTTLGFTAPPACDICKARARFAGPGKRARQSQAHAQIAAVVHSSIAARSAIMQFKAIIHP